ncbi:MAG: acyl carrier protein [Dehalococcoidia bacterium]|nr:acyl carrier protein [Dehalococcoidia bacterium]
MTVEEQVKEIVSRIVHVDQASITREGTFKEMKADSLDIVQALVAVEEKFDIEIPDEEAQKFTCFGDFVDFVVAETAKKG